MKQISKAAGLFFFFLSLLLTVGSGQASAFCYETRDTLEPVLENVEMNRDGSLTAHVTIEPAFAENMVLVFKNEQGDEAKIKVDSIKKWTSSKKIIKNHDGQDVTVSVLSGDFVISEKRLTVDPGEYTVYLEGRDYLKEESPTYPVRTDICGESTITSNEETIVIGDHAQIPEGDYFPGSVIVTSSGSIQISLHLTSEYTKAVFYLLILDKNDNVVKRIPINVNNPAGSIKNLSLSAGKYTLMIEMTLKGEKYHSNAVTWVVSSTSTSTTTTTTTTTTSTGSTTTSTGSTTSGVFSIPSGQNFPGSVKVNSNGTITITLQWQQAYNSYEVYFIVYNASGSVVKQIPINLKKPMISLKDLQLLTGGYTVVIKIVDPISGSSASSLPVFLTSNQSSDIIVFIDGQLQTFKKAPVEINGRTLVPLRAIFEALGAQVEWDEATQTVTATKDGNTIQLTIGSKTAYKNGEPIKLDVPAQLYNGDTTMVPIRFVSEALGAKVNWDPYSSSVIISND